MTTAFLTLRLLLPGGFELRGDAVRPDPRRGGAGKFDAGLIIHEGQLTFQNQGLHLVVDLGVWWQEKTGLPLPLGGNVVRRDLGAETMQQISRLLKESIRYSLDHRAGRAATTPCNMPATWTRRWRTSSSACTSTTGRSTTARAAARRVRRLLEEGHRPA